MEERRMTMRDGRRLPPRNSRGEFRRRRSRRDRGMDYESDMRMRRDMRGRDYANEMANMDMRADYRYDGMGDMARGQDYGYDGHYGMHGGRAGGYEPVEFMGYCTGYAGAKEDYARGDMGYREYDMRGRGRDYGYPMYDMRGSRVGRGRGRDYGDYNYDYGYEDYGDYGETLSEKELEEWCKKLKSKLDEREKQMFSKEIISQKAKAMGRQMEGFGEKELEVVTLMLYDDYKKTLGANPDLMIKLAFDWLDDKDASVKGAEKLAIYHDEIVDGEEE